MFFLYVFILLLPAILVAIFTDYSLYVGLGGLGLTGLGALFTHLEGRGQPGNSGHIGMLVLFVGAPLVFSLANFIAMLVKYLVMNISISWV